jgi:hypothetical protein
MSRQRPLRLFLDSNVVTAGILSEGGFDKPVLSPWAAVLYFFRTSMADEPSSSEPKPKAFPSHCRDRAGSCLSGVNSEVVARRLAALQSPDFLNSSGVAALNEVSFIYCLEGQ